jgi:hypothetical protein
MIVSYKIPTKLFPGFLPRKSKKWSSQKDKGTLLFQIQGISSQTDISNLALLRI